MNFRLTGLVAATHTPFHPDLTLNLDAVEAQAAHLLAGGVTGVFIAGTTGEGHSLTVAERRDLAARWAAVTRGTPLKLIVHVGHNCLADARELAAHATQIGADAIAALAPSYFKPASVEMLVRCCQSITEAAPTLPFYFYDIPAWTGVNLSMAEFLALGQERLPTLAGLKFTNPDLAMLQHCLRFGGGAHDILFGCDEALLAGLSLGARGAVGSTYNFAALLYQRLLAAFARGDLEAARSEQARSADLVRTIARYGYVGANKQVMTMLGVDCGPARPPVATPTPEVCAALRRDLEGIGFFEWIGQAEG